MKTNATFLTKFVLFWKIHLFFVSNMLCYQVMDLLLLFLSGLINILNFSGLITSKAIFLDIAHVDKSL